MSSGLASLLVVFIIVAAVIRSVRKQKKDVLEVKLRNRNTFSNNAYARNYNSRPSYNSVRSKERTTSSVLMDDRNNDWLAKQLRDEHIAFKSASDMFGLKIEHASHCDAQLLKNYHHLRCDAKGGETASGK